MEYTKKIQVLQKLRQDIRKKRLLLDESKPKFGMEHFEQLCTVKETDDLKGYPMKLSQKDVFKKYETDIALKIIPVDSAFQNHEHPCYVENIALKELTNDIVVKNVSPHIVFYLGTFKTSIKSKALSDLRSLRKLYIDDMIRSYTNILVSEYVSGYSTDTWSREADISRYQWKVFAFQIIYTLHALQIKYNLLHNDLHYGNILIDTSMPAKGYFVYTVANRKYYIKNTGFVPKIWDFEYCMVYSSKMKDMYPNKFIIHDFDFDRTKFTTDISTDKIKRGDHWSYQDINSPYNYNDVYDLHFFLTSMLCLDICSEFSDWIKELYPPEVIPDDSISPNSSDDETKTESSYSSSSSESESSSSSTSTSTSWSETQTHSIQSSEEVFSTFHDDGIYTYKGRLINDTELTFKLPNPSHCLDDKFFEEFLQKPDDFVEEEATYFEIRE